MTRQQAIAAKCKECTYDPLDDGTWRQQVERCHITDCALWNYRPKSRSKMPDMVDSAPVQLHYEPMSVQVGQGSNGMTKKHHREHWEPFLSA